MPKLIFSSFLLFMLLLSGCASSSIKPEVAQNIHRIGVLSLLPSDFRYTKIGITVFNNEHIAKSVGNQFRGSAFDAAKVALATQYPSRETIQVLDHDGKLASKFYDDSKMVMFYAPERIQKELAEMAKTDNLDAILVIAECINLENKNQKRGIEAFFRAGFGDIRKRGGFSEIEKAELYTNIETYVISRDGKVDAISISDSLPQPIQAPNSAKWKYDLNSNITDALHEQLTLEVVTQIRYELPKQIKSLGLAQ